MCLCALVITLPANRLRCSNFAHRTHQARPGEDRTNHQGLWLQALLLVSMNPSQWDGSPLTAQLITPGLAGWWMELAGTGQMWAVPGTAASIHCCPAAPAMPSLAVQEGFLWDGWGSVPGGVWGQRVGAPTGEMWGLWAPLFGRDGAEGGCGDESLHSRCSVVGLRGVLSSLGQGRRE